MRKKACPALSGVSLLSPESYNMHSSNTHDAKDVTGILSTPSDIAVTIHDDIGNTEEVDSSTILSREILTKIVNEKNFDFLLELGGVEGIAATLGTDLENGIRGETQYLNRQRAIYGSNTYNTQPAPMKGFFNFASKAVKDSVILLLLCCAVLTLSFGIMEEGLKYGWYDGVTIFLAVFFIIAVTSIINFCHARNLQKRMEKNKTIVDVVRDGRTQQIYLSDVVVGDVVILKIGDRVPADGLFLSDHPLHLDEVLNSTIDCQQNPFLLSGAKVIDGFGRMLVISVGLDTAWGKMMSSSITRDLYKKPPLQASLDKVNSCLQNIGLVLALLTLVLLFLRYVCGKRDDDETGYPALMAKRTTEKLMKDVEKIIAKQRRSASILASALTVLLLGIQEGLPSAVTLSLSYWKKKMTTDQVVVRKPSACVTTGSVTTICTDRNGGLTLNQMKVDEFWVGEEAINEDVIKIAPDLLEALREGVGLNATPTSVLLPGFFNALREEALRSWADLGLGMNMTVLKRSCSLLCPPAFSEEDKRSWVQRVLIRKNRDNDNTICLHWKGVADTILSMCSNYYDSNGVVRAMDEAKRKVFEQIIDDMVARGCQSVAFACKQIKNEEEEEVEQDDEVEEEGEKEELEENNDDDDDEEYEEDGDHEHDADDYSQKLEEDGLILLGLVGLKYPCQPEARWAVKACRDAGVDLKLVSQDYVSEVRAIAMDCGILAHNQDNFDGLVIEGEEFRNLSDEERMEIVNDISVMARSLPSDKLLMVQCLRQKGHVVAFAGVGISDTPALKEADVGFSMGTWNTETAKESSEITILNDNFASILIVLNLGRRISNNIQKFVQLNLTMNIVTIAFMFVVTVASGEAPLTPFQLLWVNLVINTLGALALAAEPPTQELTRKRPVSPTKHLVTKFMWRNIIIQALYQFSVLLILQFKGETILGVDGSVKKAMIFNSFVLCQVFNEFNARDTEKKNAFEGIHENRCFLGSLGAIVVLQVVMVELLMNLTGTERLGWAQWGECMVFAAFSWPIGWAMKAIPISS